MRVSSRLGDVDVAVNPEEPATYLLRTKRRDHAETAWRASDGELRHTPDADFPYRVVAGFGGVLRYLSCALESVDFRDRMDAERVGR